MLLPHEFSVGFIGGINQLTLVLPVDSYDRSFLVTLASGKPTAISLDKKDGFASFTCENNSSYKGILVPNIAVELNEKVALDAIGWGTPLGTLVRREESLLISTRLEGSLPQNTLVPIITGLPASQPNMAAGFTKWRIVIGDGPSKRILMTFGCEQDSNLSCG
jgi:hypothetical protein